jgi:hypothetical protein
MARPDILAEINFSAEDLIEAYDGNIGQAAAGMAGVPYTRGVSKNLAYKAAIRNLQRYLKGRTPTPDQQLRMNRAGRAAQGNKGHTVTYDGNIMVNGYERTRTIFWEYPPDIWAALSDLAALGDEDAVWEFIAHDYNVDEMEVIDGTIDIE